MLPVVAIVGRPNVGKSTLFNRLTRTRAALISAYPGMTRDRQYGDVHYDDQHFILIDTGGIAEDENEMTDLITQQAMQAIEEADKILFIIDGKAGLTPADYTIAEILRKKHKPIVLAVNKTESVDKHGILTDAFELGLTTPVPIAAINGQGLTELIMALKLSDEPQEEVVTSGIKLAIVGRPNAGKSTLTNRMLGEERVIVSDIPGTTRDSIYIPLSRHGHDYTLIDTAGVRRRSRVDEVPEKFSVVKTLQAIEGSNVVLFLIDGRAGVMDQDLKLLGFILECGKALVIAVNKWDNMSESEREQTRRTLDRHLDFVDFARIHYISALHGSGVGTLFESVNEAYASANKKLSTPILTRLLQQAQLKHSPPLVNGRRIKLRYAHAGGQNPPRIIIHGNQIKALPRSYQTFLSHFFIKKLELHGTPVFIEYKANENPYEDKKRRT
ncbi:MAG: ribosome biogenesis GTPase Der [Gammaproteobacteria bacterium]|nr:ribosome biogenesis GTPase Der [Gammaproteobacteria bacterium]